MSRRPRHIDHSSKGDSPVRASDQEIGHRTLTGAIQRRATSPNLGQNENELNQNGDLHSALKSGGGAPLPFSLKEQFETSLGTDLSEVRVHTGATSAAAAESVSAVAFAFGQNVHMGAGQYDPNSESGQRLLAHEVAHTVQQRGSSGVQTKLEVSTPGDSSEVEADRAADAMMSGAPAQVSLASGLARQIMRQPHPGAQQTAQQTSPQQPAPQATSPMQPITAPTAASNAWNPPARNHPGPQAIDNGIVTQAHRVTFAAGEPRQVSLRPGIYVEVVAQAGANLRVRIPRYQQRECEIPAAIFHQEPQLATSRDHSDQTDEHMEYEQVAGQAFVGPPRVEDVNQGGLGDCTFLSAAMSLITSGHAARLQQMIVPSGTGWNVTLFRVDSAHAQNGQPPPLVPWTRTIDNYFPRNEQRPQHRRGDPAQITQSGALWPLILEKAYSQLRGGYQVHDYEGYEVGELSENEVAMMALTGHRAERHRGSSNSYVEGGNLLRTPPERMLERLRQLHASGTPITMGTAGGGISGNSVTFADGTILENNHSYALDSIDAAGRIHLLNPYDRRHPKPLTAEEIQSFFGSVTFNAPTSAAPHR